MKDKPQIKIILTGGTFDKEYNPLNGELTFDNGTHIRDVLEVAQCKWHLSIATTMPMMLDSLHMNDDDRANILEECEYSQEDMIIIIHGTDTMPETAKVLKESDNLKDKTIVLVGAMIPYSMKRSDAMFNFGTAVTGVQLMDSGVYIAMNGVIFDADNVKKNKHYGRFEHNE
jgi:L-asparaginase